MHRLLYVSCIYLYTSVSVTCVHVCLRVGFCNKVFLTTLGGNLHIKRALHLHLHLCTNNVEWKKQKQQ